MRLKTKKICMVSYSSYTRDSRLRREARALCDAGYEVDVICLRRSDEPLRTSHDGIEVYRVPMQRYRGNYLQLYLRGYSQFVVLAAWRLFTLVPRRRYAVIQVHTPPDFLVFGPLPFKLLGTRLALDIRDTTPELYASRFGARRHGLMFKLLSLTERAAAAVADRIFVVHEYERELLEARGIPRHKMTVVMNSADENLFDPLLYSSDGSDGNAASSSCKEFTVLYLGTVTRRQGLDTLVRAVAKIGGGLPELRVRIVGNGDYRERLADLVRELSLENVVHLAEGVPYDQVPKEIVAADACVVPVSQDVFTDSILPVKLLEAVAMERPVIASRTKNIARHFDERAIYFVQPGNVDELARGLRALATDAVLRDRLVVEARRQVQPYRWSTVKAGYLAAMAELTGECTHSPGEVYREEHAQP